MAELILHHYATSPFSEKARAMLNARGLAWRSVIIPPIMPRPDTIPLTGGYRRTPVLQVGADVYCDTARIAALLDGLGSGPTFFPAAHLLAAQTLARWVDTELFWAAVTLRFQPQNMGAFFADPWGKSDIPFTELVQLGGLNPMPGFAPGRLFGQGGLFGQERLLGHSRAITRPAGRTMSYSM